jgi:Ca-activated chloride channel homolog
LRAQDQPGTSDVPASVAVVIDVSGSMSGPKLRDAKSAARRLVESLSVGDRLSIVSFAEEAQTHLADVVVGSDRRELLGVLDGIQVRGTTCISCGLEQGYASLAKAPGNVQRRLILLSDGQANHGLKGAAPLGSLARKGRGGEVVTSTIGLGAGYDAPVMNAIAESGAGRYYFVHNARAITNVLEAELNHIRTVMVRDLRVELRSVEGTLLGRLDAPESWLGSRHENLGPMAAKSERRVLIPLQLPPNYSGEVVTARIAFSDAQGVGHTVTLTANVDRSEDANVIHASRNPTVTAHVERTRSVRVIERALEAKARGRTDEALSLLDAAATKMEAVADETGDPDAQAEVEELKILRRKVRAFKTGSRQMRATSLLNSARGAEVIQGAPAAKSFHQNGMYNEALTQ